MRKHPTDPERKAKTTRTYNINLIRTAAKQLDELEEHLFRRVDSAILKLSSNPRPIGCSRLRGHDDVWRIRVGNYRVLYKLNDEQKEITILGVRHRREAYR